MQNKFTKSLFKDCLCKRVHSSKQNEKDNNG